MTKKNRIRRAQVTWKVDGMFGSTWVNRPVGTTDAHDYEEVGKVLRYALKAWADGNGCKCWKKSE